MNTPKPTMEGLCAMFKCTPEQIRAQYAKNVKQLEAMLAKARKLPAGKKYRGLTPSQWETKVAQFKATAETVCEP